MSEYTCEHTFCEECGGYMLWDTSVTLACDPPKYMGKCKDCESTNYAPCNDIIAPSWVSL